MTDKQHVVELLDRLEPTQVAAVVQLLEVMIREDGDEVTEQDRQAIAASLEYFRKGGEGVPYEQVVADLGFGMDQIRNFPATPLLQASSQEEPDTNGPRFRFASRETISLRGKQLLRKLLGHGC